MNCYEHAQEGRETVAVGVCPRCGAAVCAEHAGECRVEIVRSNGVGSPTLGQHRVVCCDRCRASGACAGVWRAGVDGAREPAGRGV
ncbi:DUF2180 family protein [Cellulosimicrobium sp. RS]|uniref:DUF2180 family protein n=1 Tax=Cellulosimicrobium TaxID=157920 RepID=UPI0038FD28A7